MKEARRHRRVKVEGVHGNLLFASDAEIINISLGGAAMNLNVNLRLGREYTISLTGKNSTIKLKGVVVWSVLKGSQKGTRSDVIPIYNVGIEFKDVLSNQTLELIQFIESSKIKKTEERLKGLRFKIHTTGKAMIDQSFSYRVKVISLSGMLIETIQFFKPEDRFHMELFLRDDKVVRFLGRVASCMEIEDKQSQHYNIGIEFWDISNEDKAVLDTFIRSLDDSVY